MTDCRRYENKVNSRDTNKANKERSSPKALTFNRIELVPDHLLRHECSHLGSLLLSLSRVTGTYKRQNLRCYITFFLYFARSFCDERGNFEKKWERERDRSLIFRRAIKLFFRNLLTLLHFPGENRDSQFSTFLSTVAHSTKERERIS